MEKVLNRRRAELEHALSLARGTDFTVTDTSRAAMGTKVTLQPLGGGNPVVYTILGAWDTNPEKHIVSYLSQVGKELTGKKVGDQVKIVPMDGDKRRCSQSPPLKPLLRTLFADVLFQSSMFHGGFFCDILSYILNIKSCTEEKNWVD